MSGKHDEKVIVMSEGRRLRGLFWEVAGGTGTAGRAFEGTGFGEGIRTMSPEARLRTGVATRLQKGD